MTSISAKIRNAFKNLRSDAAPSAPRPQYTENDVTEENYNSENIDPTNEQEEEEIVIEPDEKERNDVPKFKKTFFSSYKGKKGFGKSDKDKKNESSGIKTNHVNTQATGNVINIIDSSKVRVGNDFVYYLGPTNAQSKDTSRKDNNEEEYVEKTNLIMLLMESTAEPGYQYIDYVSKNLGKNWHSFFRKLGYTKGRIETFEIDEARNGVSEARYQLLLDWTRNADDATLGSLAKHLWEEGERHIVKELSLLYSKSK